MKRKLHTGNPIPIRLEKEQAELLQQFQAKTGLGKSFIIRRCISYALTRFVNDEVDILTLKDK
jgi:predicted DNA-binding protein